MFVFILFIPKFNIIPKKEELSKKDSLKQLTKIYKLR